MEKEKLQIGSCMITGDRESQQDAMRIVQKENVLFAAVCDGMGGMNGGERASQEAVNVMADLFEHSFVGEESLFPEWLKLAFIHADTAVADLTDEDGSALQSGSTAVGILVTDNRLYWGSVGDSAIYYLNSAGIRRLTRMHNFNLKLDQMLLDGTLTPEEAREERKCGRGEALISFLGIGGLPVIDLGNGALSMEPGDELILASDGLYKSLSIPQIQAVVQESGGNMKLAAERLCREAWRLGEMKQDNTTVIAIRYGERQEENA